MSILTEVSDSNKYTGNAAIGGSSLGSVELDTKPIQNLAAYAYSYNMKLHDERKKDADEKVRELADLTAFDPNSAIDKDKPVAIESYKKLVDMATAYTRLPPARSAAEKLQQDWDFKKQIAETKKTINSISGRAIAYNKRLADINNMTIPEGQKVILRKNLDDAANTDVNTPISAENKFDMSIPQIKAAELQNLEVSIDTGNNILQKKIGIFNPTDVLRQSQADVLGLKGVFVDPNSDEYKNATAADKRRYDFFNQSEDPYKAHKDGVEFYNAALNDPQYQLPNNRGIDFKAIQAANPMVHDVLTLVDDFNTWSANMQAQATQGVFQDKIGKIKTLTPIAAADFFQIDKTKPLTTDQAIMLEKFMKSPKIVVTDEAINHTGDANRLAIEREQQAGENARLRARLAAAKASGTPAEVSDDDFGNLIYGINSGPVKIDKANGGVIDNLKIKSGVFVDAQGKTVDYTGDIKVPITNFDNSLISEFNKSTGVNKVNADGSVTVTPPAAKIKLSQTYDDKGNEIPDGAKITLRMVNGEVQGVQTDDGSYATVDQFKHITKKEVYKGTTKYVPPDKTVGKQTIKTSTIPSGKTSKWDKYRVK